MTISTTELNYIELPAVDMSATKQFYADAFGWDWIDYGPTYASHQGGAVEVGLNAAGAVAPPHGSSAEDAVGAFVLFGTGDLAAAEVSVRSAGGDVVSGPYDYPGGRRFHFRDPSGNILGVYQSDDAPAAD